MRAIFDQAGDNRFLPRYLVLLGEYAGCLGQAGDIALGISTINGILARCERSEERWYVPELLRIKGELLALNDAAAPDAEIHLRQAIELAQRQDARSWQLRSTISLARLRQGRHRAAEAHAQLSKVLACFSEGFETTDLQTARQVLTELR